MNSTVKTKKYVPLPVLILVIFLVKIRSPLGNVERVSYIAED